MLPLAKDHHFTDPHLQQCLEEPLQSQQQDGPSADAAAAVQCWTQTIHTSDTRGIAQPATKGVPAIKV